MEIGNTKIEEVTQLDFIAWTLYDKDCQMDDRSSFKWLVLNPGIRTLYRNKAKSLYSLCQSDEMTARERRNQSKTTN